MVCVKDENNEVVQTALPIIKKVLSYVEKYKFMEEHKKYEVDEVAKTPFIDSNFSEFQKASVKMSLLLNNADFCRTVNVLQS